MREASGKELSLHDREALTATAPSSGPGLEDRSIYVSRAQKVLDAIAWLSLMDFDGL